MSLRAFLKAASEISKCCIADVHHYTRKPLITLYQVTEKRDQIKNIFRKGWFTQQNSIQGLDHFSNTHPILSTSVKETITWWGESLHSVYTYQIITLYTLSYNFISQLHLNNLGGGIKRCVCQSTGRNSVQIKTDIQMLAFNSNCERCRKLKVLFFKTKQKLSF